MCPCKVIAMASHVMEGAAANRLTPLECERLQDSPGGWPGVEHQGMPTP